MKSKRSTSNSPSSSSGQDSPKRLKMATSPTTSLLTSNRCAWRRGSNDVRNMINLWRFFRQNENFTDLHVLCGTDGYGCVSLHRAVLALHSPFLAELMADKDETFLILPDVSKDDFMDLVKLLYCDKTDSQNLPSDNLLKLLGITSIKESLGSPGQIDILQEEYQVIRTPTHSSSKGSTKPSRQRRSSRQSRSSSLETDTKDSQATNVRSNPRRSCQYSTDQESKRPRRKQRVSIEDEDLTSESECETKNRRKSFSKEELEDSESSSKSDKKMRSRTKDKKLNRTNPVDKPRVQELLNTPEDPETETVSQKVVETNQSKNGKSNDESAAKSDSNTLKIGQNGKNLSPNIRKSPSNFNQQKQASPTNSNRKSGKSKLFLEEFAYEENIIQPPRKTVKNVDNRKSEANIFKCPQPLKENSQLVNKKCKRSTHHDEKIKTNLKADPKDPLLSFHKMAENLKQQVKESLFCSPARKRLTAQSPISNRTPMSKYGFSCSDSGDESDHSKSNYYDVHSMESGTKHLEGEDQVPNYNTFSPKESHPDSKSLEEFRDNNNVDKNENTISRVKTKAETKQGIDLFVQSPSTCPEQIIRDESMQCKKLTIQLSDIKEDSKAKTHSQNLVSAKTILGNKLPSQCFAEAREAQRLHLEREYSNCKMKSPQDKELLKDDKNERSQPIETPRSVSPSSSSSSRASSSSSSDSDESEVEVERSKDKEPAENQNLIQVEEPQVAIETDDPQKKNLEDQKDELESKDPQTNAEPPDKKHDGPESDSEWSMESFKLVLTESSKKSVVDEESDHSESEQPNPEPEPLGELLRPSFNHFIVPAPQTHTDNFLHTPVYFSTYNDNFLQTPLHPFSFTEEEIEEELRDTSTPNLCLLNFHHNDPIKPTALTSNNEKSKSAIQNSTEIPTTTQMLPPEPPPPLTPNRFVQQISQILEPALKEANSLSLQSQTQLGDKSENSPRADSGDDSDSDDDSASLWSDDDSALSSWTDDEDPNQTSRSRRKYPRTPRPHDKEGDPVDDIDPQDAERQQVLRDLYHKDIENEKLKTRVKI